MPSIAFGPPRQSAVPCANFMSAPKVQKILVYEITRDTVRGTLRGTLTGRVLPCLTWNTPEEHLKCLQHFGMHYAHLDWTTPAPLDNEKTEMKGKRRKHNS